jgi:hypothetical protein
MVKLYFSSIILLVSLALSAQDTRTWSSYYGGSASENVFSTVTDPFGNVFIAGITMSANGMSYNGHQMTFGGGIVDAFVAKFSPAGGRIWATYYGGTGEEMTFFGGRMGLCTDGDGNVYLAGLTNSTTNIASGGFQNTNAGGQDAYLVKFDSAGVRQWATYYGGAGADFGYDCTCDANGNVYLTGVTGSTGLAINGFQNSLSGTGDAFLVKFNSAGTRMWATYYGGTASEEGYAVATDASLNVYLAGSTGSSSSIASGGFQNTYGGGSSDAFLVKLDSTGNRLWATYFGGTGAESYPATNDMELVADPAGAVYMSGYTESTNAIAMGGSQLSFGGGAYDAYLLKTDAAGNRVWSTYYGGSGDEVGHGCAIDSAGNIFLSGTTSSTTGISLGGFQVNFGGNEDGFLVKFNSLGVRLCATYFGGSDLDWFQECAVGTDGTIYCAGSTANMSGIAFNGYMNSYAGGTADGLLVKFTPCNDLLSVSDTSPDKLFSLYPNPSTGIVTFETMMDHPTVEIRNVLGQIIFTSEFEHKIEVDLSAFPSGIYTCQISSGETLITEKLIVE